MKLFYIDSKNNRRKIAESDSFTELVEALDKDRATRFVYTRGVILLPPADALSRGNYTLVQDGDSRYVLEN